MSAEPGPAPPGLAHRVPRAVAYGLVTTGVVLAVCVVIGVGSALSLHRLDAGIRAAISRAAGTITAVDGAAVELRWRPAGAPPRTDRVPLAVAPPPVGTPAEVAYDPGDPSAPLIPGSAVLAEADGALSGVALSVLVGAAVLAGDGWQLVSRARLRRRPGHPAAVRRVRVQSGLLARSWLETESGPTRWIPVHFDPLLVTLPAPIDVWVHGDPRHQRLVAARLDGRWLYPSGRVRSTEPRGRRTDNPRRPDADAEGRAVVLGRLRRQLRTDLVLVVPAPFIGLLWTYLDNGGIATWAGVTAVTASLGVWSAALRGSDPS